ncbi:MAG: hypothetical protein KBC16_03830, partial [Candidatus Pacebacteria bacterium]|nr:hypothetical protein [Candidatus Paceibacterota bacterium]
MSKTEDFARIDAHITDTIASLGDAPDKDDVERIIRDFKEEEASWRGDDDAVAEHLALATRTL